MLGGYFGDTAPSYLSISFKVCDRNSQHISGSALVQGSSCVMQVGSPPEAAAKKQFLALADVVIYEMSGHEQAARDAVVHMNRQPVSAPCCCCNSKAGEQAVQWGKSRAHALWGVRVPAAPPSPPTPL